MNKKKTQSVIVKLVQERIKVLEVDPEFIKLRKLVPKALKGKESGKDFFGVTDDPELYERNKDNGTILLSKNDMKRYHELMLLCEEIGNKYGLGWVTVLDLVMGIKQPMVSPRLSRTITAHLEPLVYLPKPFDPNKHYIAKSSMAPPLEAIEIMRRIQNLDQETRDEIKAYLSSLFKDEYGCRVVELYEAPQGQTGDDIEINISFKIPIGYTANEVANTYRKLDNRRREILTALGISTIKRRRASNILMDAKNLKLYKSGVKAYDLVDKIFGQDYSEQHPEEDQRLRKAIINKRYRGKKQIKKRLEG